MAKSDPPGKPLSFFQQLVLGVSLAAAGAAGTYFVGRDGGRITICTQAVQVVNDETKNPDLTEVRRKELTERAASKTMECFGKD